jgi:glycosyltransferase involved in cell wall biosynthesis
MAMLNFDDLRPLTANLPPIALLCSIDYGGPGAGSVELLRSLRAAGADADMLCIEQKYHAEGVETATVHGKSAKTLWLGLQASALRDYSSRPHGYEAFSSNKSAINLADYEMVKRAGLVHLRWIPGLVGFPRSLNALQDKPLVWTLHNMSPFTGGCHCTAGCDKFITGGCAKCPQLGEPSSDKDLAGEGFAAKRAGYAGLKLLVAPVSRWIGDCARQSVLMRDFPQATTPNSIDTNIFSPLPRRQSRAVFGLPPDRKIIVFSAWDIRRRNKGIHILLRALNLSASRRLAQKPLLLIVGEASEKMSLQGHDCCFTGFIEDKAKLAAAYSAADLYVSPSFQDAFGRTTAEAQACGTPGIGFYNTGAEDIIRHGITGYLAKHPGLPLEGGAVPPLDGAYLAVDPDSIADLAAMVAKALTLPPDEYTAMRHACREHALAEYTLELQAARLLLVYRRILGLPEILFPLSLNFNS